MIANAARFCSRAADYARGRPGYPDAVAGELERLGLARGDLVVDAGAGTGISSLLFLCRGYRVIAVEPNPEMRQAAIAAGVDARPGTGERTGLPDSCAGLVVCAQAFHWMDRSRAWAEFQRVARRGALIALLWNHRVTSGSPFLLRLETTLRKFAISDPAASEASHLRQWPGTERVHFQHSQPLDWPALLSRVSSMSWMPLPGSPEHAAMAGALHGLFAEYNSAGRVEMLYDCAMNWTVNASF